MGLYMQAYTYVCQQKWANPMESVESSYKQLNSCFVAIESFHKVYYASKGLTFFLLKNGCGPLLKRSETLLYNLRHYISP